MKNAYMWYSPATDVTGKILADKLGCDSGTKKPTGKYDTVICWGTKTKDVINLANANIFNHPNNIKTNRNKFSALKKMKEAGCKVAPFSENKNNMEFPIIGRTKYHQGGAGFWLCLNDDQVVKASAEGAQYFQNYINIKDEYRLHVVGGKVIYAVKKVARTNLKDAFVNHYTNYVTNYAEKNDVNIDAKLLEFTLRRLARKMATSVDMIVRSNARGWKFSSVNIPNLNADLKKQAIKAVESLGLNYGAVDCCTTADGSFIIECNTGPGLEGSSLNAWVTALIDLVGGNDGGGDKKKVAKKQAPKIINELAKDKVKKTLKAQAKMMEAMVDAADGDELEALQGLWEKMGVA